MNLDGYWISLSKQEDSHAGASAYRNFVFVVIYRAEKKHQAADVPSCYRHYSQ